MRTTPEENQGDRRVDRRALNQCEGQVRFLLPLGGRPSAIDAPGMPFHDPAADEALFAAIRAVFQADRQPTPDRSPPQHQRRGLCPISWPNIFTR